MTTVSLIRDRSVTWKQNHLHTTHQAVLGELGVSHDLFRTD